MEIFTHEFKSFLKLTIICSWRGHISGKWEEVYWAPAHPTGYRSKYCEFCNQQLETAKQKNVYHAKMML